MVICIVDKKDLEVKLQEAGDKLVVLDFYAVWCGPCKLMAPKIEELEKTLPNVVFMKIDVDDNEEIAAEYEISAMPTFVFIKNGNKLDSFSGANYNKLKDIIDQLAN
ncbi:UNVERIFIED_CONTAM: hypothetical protein PYX00_004978 [Menopon gallinae]|uniref:Thioredoxin n=1 Tax=Menopon gallinae TaxID=328185 RepID=A0AAW2I6L5_9NEOP